MNRIVEVAFNLLFWGICYYLFVQIFAIQTVDIEQMADGRVIRNVTYSQPSLWSISIGFLLKTGYYYFNVYYLSRFYDRSSWTSYLNRLIPVSLLFMLLEVVKMVCIYEKLLWADSILILVLQYVILTLMSVAHFLLLRFNKDQIQLQQLQKEKALAELKALKSQVNPHFLFNAFNNLISITNKSGSAEATYAISQLSDMMRFLLEDMALANVPIQKEINFIENFIDINRLRFEENDDIQISFVYDGDLHQSVEPGLLIPFVENAFKHGVQPFKPSYVDIQLNITEDVLNFRIKNSIHSNSKAAGTSGGKRHGVGLKNARSRLLLAYPNKYELHTGFEHQSFYVYLNIQLT